MESLLLCNLFTVLKVEPCYCEVSIASTNHWTVLIKGYITHASLMWLTAVQNPVRFERLFYRLALRTEASEGIPQTSRGFTARSYRKKALATQATHPQFWLETKIQEKYLLKGEFMPEELFKVVKLSLFKLCLSFVVEWCILFTYSTRVFL